MVFYDGFTYIHKLLDIWRIGGKFALSRRSSPHKVTGPGANSIRPRDLPPRPLHLDRAGRCPGRESGRAGSTGSQGRHRPQTRPAATGVRTGQQGSPPRQHRSASRSAGSPAPIAAVPCSSVPCRSFLAARRVSRRRGLSPGWCHPAGRLPPLPG